jgi:hypothetical protein
VSWQHLSAIAFAAATVLVLAVALNPTHGLAETATMLAVIAVIVGAYALPTTRGGAWSTKSRLTLNTSTNQLLTFGMRGHIRSGHAPRPSSRPAERENGHEVISVAGPAWDTRGPGAAVSPGRIL